MKILLLLGTTRRRHLPGMMILRVAAAVVVDVVGRRKATRKTTQRRRRKMATHVAPPSSCRLTWTKPRYDPPVAAGPIYFCRGKICGTRPPTLIAWIKRLKPKSNGASTRLPNTWIPPKILWMLRLKSVARCGAFTPKRPWPNCRRPIRLKRRTNRHRHHNHHHQQQRTPAANKALLQQQHQQQHSATIYSPPARPRRSKNSCKTKRGAVWNGPTAAASIATVNNAAPPCCKCARKFNSTRTKMPKIVANCCTWPAKKFRGRPWCLRIKLVPWPWWWKRKMGKRRVPMHRPGPKHN
mmetsp:Transcript_29444/g.80894  ORF Transcript_29444/g.80894 Transcript_29444/m.80894 type:complete len:296 (+) Transcript_29444:1231-2118(+)